MAQRWSSTYLYDHESVLGVYPVGHCDVFQVSGGEEGEGQDNIAVLSKLGNPSRKEEQFLSIPLRFGICELLSAHANRFSVYHMRDFCDSLV